MLVTSTFGYVLWAAVMCGNAAVAVTIISRGLASRWASLLTICSVEVLAAVVLFTQQKNYAHYFYIAWGVAFLQSLLRMWLLADVFASIPGLRILPGDIKKMVAVASVVLTAGCFVLTSHDGANATNRILKAILLLDRCIDFAWGGFFVVVLASFFILQMGWPRQSARITTGIVAKIVAGITVSMMTSFGDMAIRTAASRVSDLVGFFVLCLWTFALSQQSTEISSTDRDVLKLQTLLHKLSLESESERESSVLP